MEHNKLFNRTNRKVHIQNVLRIENKELSVRNEGEVRTVSAENNAQSGWSGLHIVYTPDFKDDIREILLNSGYMARSSENKDLVRNIKRLKVKLELDTNEGSGSLEK